MTNAVSQAGTRTAASATYSTRPWLQNTVSTGKDTQASEIFALTYLGREYLVSPAHMPKFADRSKGIT